MKDMQKMNNKTGVLLGISVGAAALIAAACSSDPASNNNPPITPTPVGSTTGPGTVVTPTPSTTGPTSDPVTPTSSSTGAPNPTTSVPTTPMSDCQSTNYSADNNDLATADFPGVVAYYGYGDSATSLCSGITTPTTAGKLCVEGNAVSSKGPDSDYQYYGAGVGLQMVVATDGVAEAPWDATAAGVVSVRFTASELAGRHVRVQISQINDPADTTKVYQDNNFVWGGTKYSSKELAAGDDGVITIPLAEFALPEWSATALGLEKDAVLDATKIYALSFQIANNPNNDTELYSFCVAGLEWLDAAGNPVNVVAPDPGGTGGEGSDTGAVPSGGSDTSTPPADSSGGGDSSGGNDTGAAVNFAADIQPIFTSKCTSCHSAAPRMVLTAEPNAQQAAEIVTKVKSTDAAVRMPKGGPALDPADISKIEAWANSL